MYDNTPYENGCLYVTTSCTCAYIDHGRQGLMADSSTSHKSVIFTQVLIGINDEVFCPSLAEQLAVLRKQVYR